MSGRSNAPGNKRIIKRSARWEAANQGWRSSKATKSINDRRAVGESSSTAIQRELPTHGNEMEDAEPATILSWLIYRNTIIENTEVFLESNQNTRVQGKIQKKGILCEGSGCSSVSTFHALHGGKNPDKPYLEIFTQKGQCLLSCMAEAWSLLEESKHRESSIIQPVDKKDTFDDACLICGNGGDLMCCDGCSSTYHPECVGLKVVPKDSWYCAYCTCKFCPDSVRVNDSSHTCPLCEKSYHPRCQISNDGGLELNSTPVGLCCDRTCEQVFDRLTNDLLGKRMELGDGYSCTLLRRKDGVIRTFDTPTYLRLLHNSKLAVARKLIADSFQPIIDRLTEADIIAGVVYSTSSSNFWRINFGNFFTAILEKDEEIISVASLRIRGNVLAEMPFIATSRVHRSKGMCRKLMNAIESALRSLGVKNLIIPSASAPGIAESWKERYGFTELDSEMKKEIMCHNTLTFHTNERLQKRLQ